MEISSDMKIESSILDQESIQTMNKLEINELSQVTDVSIIENDKVDVRETSRDISSGSMKIEHSFNSKLCNLSRCAFILSCFYFICHFSDNISSSGRFLFQIFGVVLYIFDVVTDMVSGANLISGAEMKDPSFYVKNLTNYTNKVCDNILDHSNVVWGSINIAFAWFPALIPIANIIYHWKIVSKLPQMNWIKQCATVLILFIFWPLFGFML